MDLKVTRKRKKQDEKLKAFDLTNLLIIKDEYGNFRIKKDFYGSVYDPPQVIGNEKNKLGMIRYFIYVMIQILNELEGKKAENILLTSEMRKKVSIAKANLKDLPWFI